MCVCVGEGVCVYVYMYIYIYIYVRVYKNQLKPKQSCLNLIKKKTHTQLSSSDFDELLVCCCPDKNKQHVFFYTCPIALPGDETSLKSCAPK